MRTTVSPEMLSALFARETSQVIVSLLTVTHSSLSSVIRISSDLVNVSSRGNTFIGVGFRIVLPNEKANEAPLAKIQINNVDRVLLAALSTITGPPLAKLEVVLASTPDRVELGPWDFFLLSVSWNAATIQAELVYDDFTNQRFPGDLYTPADFPGLF